MVHQFKIKFRNRLNANYVKLSGYLEDNWTFGQSGSFRSEYEGKYFSSKAEFVSTLNKFLKNPNASIDSVQVNNSLPKEFQFWTTEGKQQAAEAVAELIAQVN